MTALPECQHRGPEIPEGSGRHLCASNRVAKHNDTGTVPPGFCLRCWCADRPNLPGLAPSGPAAPCRYAGAPTGATVPCTTCRGHVRLKVFECHCPGHADNPTSTAHECLQCRLSGNGYAPAAVEAPEPTAYPTRSG